MIHTIGYGNRKWDEFLSILQRYGITVLVDIRTIPFSRFNSAFRRGTLEKQLIGEGVRYMYLGDGLGGKPKDPSMYAGGKLNYSLVESSMAYQQDILKLLELERCGESVCLMCSEQKPSSCHRKNLVGQTLENLGLTIMHIDEKGNIENVENDGLPF